MAMFKIMRGDPAIKYAEWTNTVAVGFTDPTLCAAEVKRRNAVSEEEQKYWEQYKEANPTIWVPGDLHYRCRMVKVVEAQDYYARELARTDNPVRLPDYITGNIRLTRFDGSDFPDIMDVVHKCFELKAPNLVSFYESLENAYEGKRTEMKIGRFVEKYCYTLCDVTLAKVCAEVGMIFDIDMHLKFARTREDCAKVYREGPSSCMSSDKATNFDNIHPAEAYASGELGVAYLLRNDRITARAVVNFERKQYSVIYGDSARMETLLKNEGYKPSENTLAGAKLLKIIYEDNRGNKYVILPYIDGRHTAILDEGDPDYLTIRREPTVYHGGTSGYCRYADPEDS